jgi:type I restriction-modification system DNA methylase subunit
MAKGNNQKPANGSRPGFTTRKLAQMNRRGVQWQGWSCASIVGLTLLKYISYAFEEESEQLLFGFNELPARSKEALRRAYEYSLGKFTSAKGKEDTEFYTPRCPDPVLAEIVRPYAKLCREVVAKYRNNPESSGIVAKLPFYQ